MSDQPEALGNVRTLRKKALEAAPPKPGGPDGKGRSQDEMSFLPADCPVKPIGVNGDVNFYLDQLGQLRELKARDHSRLNLQHMFGRKSHLLYEYWPRKSQDKQTGEWITTGWKPELVAEVLAAECARLGVWSAEEKVRGAGAWMGPDGELILHCGDELLMVPATPDADRATDRWLRRAPGLVDDLVYPTGARGMKPSMEAQAPGPDGPAAELLEILRTWNWRRPIDAHLMLGWIGAAMLGGALDWRVVAWITGGKGTGKSTLQGVIKNLMGDHGLVQTSDASAAGIRQTLKFASRPVALDEAEAEEDGRKMQALIKLARDAASGSIALRGGQDHTASAFIVRSCFLFSSILIPPLLGQDRSRIAVLELDKIEALNSTKSAALTPRKMKELGERLQRRLIGQWYRFAETVALYQAAMAEAKHSARGQDLFGTLLACADCLLSNGVPAADVLAGWAAKLKADSLAEVNGDISDEAACLGHMLSSQLDAPHDRVRQSVGEWIRQAAVAPPQGLFPDDVAIARMNAANRILQDAGMKVVVEEGEQYLAVANMHRGIAKVFENTHWAMKPGANGVWVQALRRLPHVVPPKSYWLGGTCRVTLLPINLCLPETETSAPEPKTTSLADDPFGEFP